MRTERALSFALLAVFLFGACGGRVGNPAALTVDPSPVSLEPGEALAFAATGQEALAGRPETLAWSVQESGGGTADARKKATVTVQVRRRGIRVRITPSVATLSTGDSTTFTALVRGTRSRQSTAVKGTVPVGAS